MILSKYVYGCDSWTLQDRRSKHFVHSSLMRLYRRLLLVRPDVHLGDDDILHQTSLSEPSDLFRQQRLRHLGALYACADTVPWGLINQDAEWMQLITDDLRWMWENLQSSSSLPDPSSNFEAWTYLMQYHRGYWKRLIKRACAHAAAQRDNRLEVRDFHRCVLAELHGHGILLQGPPTTVTEFPETCHGCMLCERRFSSRSGCGAHMFRAHGHIHPVRQLFDTSQCGCCLREFHSFGRLKAHLIRADFCRHSLQRRGHFVPPTPGIGSLVNDSQERAIDGLLHPAQGEGPRVPGDDRAGAGLHEIDYDLTLFERIYEQFLDAEDETQGEKIIRAEVQLRPLSWEVVQRTLQALAREANDEDTGVLPMGAPSFFALLRRMGSPGSWSFLQTREHVAQGHWSRPLEVLEAYCRIEADEVHSEPSPCVPRGFGAMRFVLHVFSGRRRCGDFQVYFDRLAADFPDFHIQVISVDVVIDSEWGDIMSPSTREFWLRAVRERYVVAALGGPPCETWSQAREHALPGARSGPRVIRTPESPWGRSSLRLKELGQLRVGNVLMGFMLEIFTELFCVQGVAVIEHPAPPTRSTSVSIWHTSILELLRSLPGVELVQLAQGLWGAKSPKPTALLTLNAPDLRGTLRRWQVSKDLPAAASIGLDSQGHWSTAVLKEYPPALNGGLAEGLLAAVSQCHSDITVTVPPAVLHRCLSMVCHDFGTCIGPDFAGGTG